MDSKANQKYLIFNLVSVVLSVLLLLRLAFVNNYANAIILSLVLFIVFLILTMFTRSNKLIEFSKLIFVFCVGILLRLIPAMGKSGSDVYWISKESIDYLIHGINPYASTFIVKNNPAITQPVSIQAYFPFTIIFEIPFQQFLGDLRYGIIFADVGIAILLYLIIKKKDEDLARASASFYMLVSALTFVFPNNIFDYRTSDGLTDPIMTFLLLLSVYMYIRSYQKTSALIMGISIATRQFSILFYIPMILLWLKKNNSGKRRSILIIISAITASVILIPFFIWSPLDFIHDTLSSTSGHLDPSLGAPQWNAAIFPQMKFLGFDISLTIVKIIQLSSISLLVLYYRNKITDIYTSLRLFLLIYVVFLAFNNFTQYFYWFNMLPYLLIVFVFYYKKQNEIETKN